MSRGCNGKFLRFAWERQRLAYVVAVLAIFVVAAVCALVVLVAIDNSAEGQRAEAEKYGEDNLTIYGENADDGKVTDGKVTDGKVFGDYATDANADDGNAFAKDGDATETEKQLSDGVERAIDNLNLDQFEKYLESLGDEQKKAIGIENLKAALKALADGKTKEFFPLMVNALKSALSNYFFSFLPSFVIIIVISVLKSVLEGMTSGFKSETTNEIVHFVCYSVSVVLVASALTDTVSAVTDTLVGMQKFASVVFPVLLTLLSALGGMTSSALLQPFTAAFGGWIIALVSGVVVPMFLSAAVFTVVGNISKHVKLNKLNKLIRTAAGWLMGTVFGLFAALLTAEGVAGGVTDKLSFNAAKFALSSYVPILGGYLSDGFDLVSASAVLVKNALGVTGVAVLFSLVLFPLAKAVGFVLALRLTSAVVEPIGDERTASLCGALAKDTSLLISALLGVGFLFFALLMLTIGACNTGA